MARIPEGFHRVAIKARIRDSQGRILLVRERSETWDLPGGALEANESIDQALTREIQEELGVGIRSYNSEQPKLWKKFDDTRGVSKLLIVFDVVPDSENFTISDEVPEIRYFSETELDLVNLDLTLHSFVDYLFA